jgi:hypothetical protein
MAPPGSAFKALLQTAEAQRHFQGMSDGKEEEEEGAEDGADEGELAASHYEGNDSDEKGRHARWEHRLKCLRKLSAEGQADEEVAGSDCDQPPGMKRQRPPAHPKKTDAEKRCAVVECLRLGTRGFSTC